MTISRRALIKGTIAVLVGVPVTALYLPLVIIVIMLGGAAGFEAIPQGPLKTLEVGALALWGFAGLVGLLGFWAWVFSRTNISASRRIVLAICIFIGVCAVFPLAGVGSYVYVALAALGCAVGLIICGWLVLPNLPLNPDARQEQPRAG